MTSRSFPVKKTSQDCAKCGRKPFLASIAYLVALRPTGCSHGLVLFWHVTQSRILIGRLRFFDSTVKLTTSCCLARSPETDKVEIPTHVRIREL